MNLPLNQARRELVSCAMALSAILAATHCHPNIETVCRYSRDYKRRKDEMKYRKMGNTGLIVSEVALGTMQFGGKMNMGNLGQEETTRMVKLALGKGINFFDTADVYSLGESETLLGNALKGIREEIVV